MIYLLLILGLVLLIGGAWLLVDGSSMLARHWNVSDLYLGLTVAALGSSIPVICSDLAGSEIYTLTNVMQSDIFNILFVVGIGVVIAPFVLPKISAMRDLACLLASTVLLALMVQFGVDINSVEGIIFMILLAVFLYVLSVTTFHQREHKDTPNTGETSLGRGLLFAVLGAVIIYFGGRLTLDNGLLIAISMGFGETLAALRGASILVSLPVLVTTIVAAAKREPTLAFGNAVGSSIINILFTLGLAGAMAPQLVLGFNRIDAWILALSAFALFGHGFFAHRMSRAYGIVSIVLYCVYFAYLFMR